MTTFNFNDQASCVVHQVEKEFNFYSFGKIVARNARMNEDMIFVNLLGVKSALEVLAGYAENTGDKTALDMIYLLAHNLDIVSDGVQDLANRYNELLKQQ